MPLFPYQAVGVSDARNSPTLEIKSNAYWLERALDLLSETLAKWEDEEDSVREEKEDHIRDLNAFFLDWHAYRKQATQVPQAIQVLRAYARLHDGLSDMIEGSRLTEKDIPNDYRWLVQSLASISPQIDCVLARADSSDAIVPIYSMREYPKHQPTRIDVCRDDRHVCSIRALQRITDLQRQDARRIVEALELLDWISSP